VRDHTLSRLLLVEDNPAYARLLEALLAEIMPEVKVTVRGSLGDALLVLESEAVDAILLDLGLPDAEGLEPVERVHAAAPLVPIVVLSGEDDLDVALGTMRVGAQEYLVKGQAERELLPRALRYAAERKRMQDFEQLLLGVVSHDLKNPLAAVSMGADLMNDLSLPAEARAVVTRMERATHRATALVADLMDLTAIRVGGGLAVHLATCWPAQAVRRVADELRVVYPAKTLELELDDKLAVQWDGPRFEQMVQNLTGNALQHGGDGAVSLTLRRDGDHGVLAVENQGEIPRDVRDVLFAPLKRASQRRHGAMRSLGLGLYIADAVVTAHGGSIEVDASGGKTRIAARIPVEPAG